MRILYYVLNFTATTPNRKVPAEETPGMAQLLADARANKAWGEEALRCA